MTEFAYSLNLNLCNVMCQSFGVLEQFEERNGRQINKMRKNRIQIKPTLNVKLPLNVHC